MALLSRFYNHNKDGKGVKKKKLTDKERFSLKGFWDVYKDKFWKLIVLNLIFCLFLSPALFAVLAFTGVFDTQADIQSNVLYAPLYGTQLCSPNLESTTLLGIFGTKVSFLAENEVTRTFKYLSLLVFLTFGLGNVGLTYMLRSYTRGEFVYTWHDFIGGIKKNFFPALFYGIADLLLCVLLVYETVYYYKYSINLTYMLMFLVAFAMSVIYFLMRFYIYLLIITFKQSPIKLIKNSFILALLGIKRNAMALLGMAVVIIANIIIFMFIPGFGLIMPFFFTIATCTFMAVFAAYANVKKYMIDPYYADHPEEKEVVVEEEPIFIDRG